ncbi:hypothetical protein AHMF7605_04085 [Adhaeribacter arboris]|uniref:Secretion system C-terminal sorting domain-containing protein n=1 Tax=Adhaeribacter arboris TaxID=2072846 RepID=A0A2T2YB72_9BACT|nr:ELWxxDGT repeat protein [Adhaeribacter arboris]PSR52757.1 hypothetical protein AHMF7605_04085 [Adhaeribacter arboris]
MKKTLRLLFTFSLVPFIHLHAQTQLTDFRNRADDKSSSPVGFVSFNNKLFFEATTENEGREIWVTDGTDTHILKDIHPGNNSGIIPSLHTLKQGSVVLKDKLYFIASDGENGAQIWSTEGTEQSTKRVTNLSDLNTSTLTLVNNFIYFVIKKNEQLEVWKSDGTNEGTVLVKKDVPTANAPSFEGTVNNLYFFTIQTPKTNTSTLWRSDGTDAGTFPITDELEGNGAGGGTASPTQYIAYKNELYFVVRSFTHFQYPVTVGIMKTDGTWENTKPVKAVHEGSLKLLSFADVIQINDKLYFSFFEREDSRLFIWESDGTNMGTKKIYDELSTSYFAPSYLSSQGNNLVFTGKSSKNGTALLTLDLKNYTLTEIKELAPGIEKAPYSFFYDVFSFHQLTNNSFLLFEPYFLENKTWKTDLTGLNTVAVSNLKSVKEAINLGEYVYFHNSTEEAGMELWKSDLALKNPRQVTNINKAKYGLEYAEFGVVKDKLVFNAEDGATGNEPWVYDNSTNQTKLLKEVIPGKNQTYLGNFTNVNDRLYFVVNNKEYTTNLWQTDGTEAGTFKIKNYKEDIPYISVQYLTKKNNRLFFFATLKDYHQVLCYIEGLNTVKVKDLGVNMYNVAVRATNMVLADDYLYFTTDGAGGELWKSDGTEEGTTKVKSFYAIYNLTAVKNKVYFSAAQGNQDEYELWQSNGTEAGTILVKNIGKNYSSYPEQLVNLNGVLIFSAATQEFGREYWKTDGTAEGTVQIADINPGPATSTFNSISSIYYSYAPIVSSYTIFNNYLYFSANDGSHGTELWRTDGTTSGTSLVSDVNQGPIGSFPQPFTSNNGKIYFSAFSASYGTELWSTEGTAATTKQLFDLNNGLPGSYPTKFSFINDKIFFMAGKNDSGRQLWSYSKDNVTAVKEFRENSSFKVYPNPTYDYLHLETGNKKVQSLKLYNLQGRNFPIEKNQADKVYVGNLPSGIYLLVTEMDNKIITRKFIKK